MAILPGWPMTPACALAPGEPCPYFPGAPPTTSGPFCWAPRLRRLPIRRYARPSSPCSPTSVAPRPQGWNWLALTRYRRPELLPRICTGRLARLKSIGVRASHSRASCRQLRRASAGTHSSSDLTGRAPNSTPGLRRASTRCWLAGSRTNSSGLSPLVMDRTRQV